MITAIFYNSAWYIYNFRRNLIAELQNAGHTVVAISPVDEFVAKLEELGVKHYPIKLDPLNTNPFRELLSILDLGRLLYKIKPQYVLSYTIKCNLYAGLVNKLFAFQQIANISGLGQVFDKNNFLNKMVCMLYRAALKKARCIFFQNREDLALCIEKGLVPCDQSFLLPGSGVDLKYFAPSGSDRSDPIKFLMFGRLLPKKGYDLFLAAAYQLKARYGEKVEFQIMGVPDEKRLASLELFEQAKLADSEGKIKLISKKSDVRPVLQAVDVVVLPSTYNEGIPRSLLEALACGKAVITTEWKGCRETVVNGENGYLINAGSLEALTDALEKLINSSSHTLEMMGKKSRLIAEQRFDEKLVLNEYLSRMPRAA